MKLNVTPDEYAELRLAARQERLPQHVRLRYGIIAGSYEIVVRRDVPSIPWTAKGVKRIKD